MTTNLRCVAALGQEDWRCDLPDAVGGDHTFLDAFHAGELVHDVEHDAFDDRSKPTGTALSFHRELDDRVKRIVFKAQFDALELEESLVLFHQRVFGLPEDLDEIALRELVEADDHRESADEFRDESKADEIFPADVF